MNKITLIILFGFLSSFSMAQTHFWENGNSSLEGTQLMVDTANMSDKMLRGINDYFDRKIEASLENRKEFWDVDFSGKQAFENSITENRKSFASIIGIADSLDPDVDMEYVSTTTVSAKVAENHYFIAYAVRWHLYGEVYGEGLLLQPKNDPKARIVAIPDADQTPESLVGLVPGLPAELQYARHLAETGCQVVIPTIVDRTDSLSGNERLGRHTNQPHREWIYRQSYTFGRHIIGYEVQKIIAAIHWFEIQNREREIPIGVVGWGEGGLLGLYSSAIDTRIDAALISGYFGKREDLWKEPIYRNVFGLLHEFGDAEITRLIAPRKLIVEYAESPVITGPPPPRKSKGGTRTTESAAPGKIMTPSFEDLNQEVTRARELLGKYSESIRFTHDNGKTTGPVSQKSLLAFLNALGTDIRGITPNGTIPKVHLTDFNFRERQLRQVLQLEQYTQQLIHKSRHVRDTFFWDKTTVTNPTQWKENMDGFRDKLWNDVIGRIPASQLPLNPHSRQIFNEDDWAGYEVTLDVLPGVMMWGYLLIPKNLKEGEKRPVIVAQHGGSGLPEVVMDPNSTTYKAFATQLVEEGYIVFAPHFPWRGGHPYRDIQRKANPLGLSVFSIILNQHETLLRWLMMQPWVDTERIGFYGLSWGGKVAVRVPALVEGYSLSVCSGDFNEWIWKNATTDWPNSYMFVPEYEMFDFNLGSTFNYGEMAALIAPRPFMVERGHRDGVGIDEWVAFEYAKVRRLYDELNIPVNTSIEYFNGVHEINAEGTFEFIRQHFGRID